MKGFTTLMLVVVAASVVLGQGQPEIDECKAKAGATDADMAELQAHTSPTTRGGACLMACILKKAGLMHEDNKIAVDFVKKEFESVKNVNMEAYNKLVNSVDECNALVKDLTDECEIAKNFDACAVEKRKAITI